MKKIHILLPFVFVLFLNYATVISAQGTEIYSDSFTNVDKVDTAKTTAIVNTAEGWVEAWHPPQSAVIDSSEQNGNLDNVVVATESGIMWYSLDKATGSLKANQAKSANSIRNALAVSMVPETDSYFIFDDAGNIKHLQFDGSGMVHNPLMSISGLKNLVTVTAVNESTVAAAESDGTIKAYTFDTATGTMVENPALKFSTGLTDIVGVHNIPGTYNFVVTTRSGKSYEYDFDPIQGYKINASRTIIHDSQTIVASGIAGQADIISLLDPNKANAYVFDGSANSMTKYGLLSADPLQKAIAVSLPNETTQLIASSEGSVNVYQLDGATNRMVSNPFLEIKGLTFVKSYAPQSSMESKAFMAPSAKTMFQLLPSETNDPGTSIQYSMSVDGGNSFTPVQPNDWFHLPEDSATPIMGPFVVKATLISGAKDKTARLTDLKLNAYYDVTPPTAPGKPFASPNPSYQITTPIHWEPASDILAAPSDGASGIKNYQFRSSIDGGKTWSEWVNTNSNSPNYNFSVPPDSAAVYHLQVRAVDAAGNIGPESLVGEAYINTKPVQIVPNPAGHLVTVNKIIEPSEGQSFPTDQVRVRVKAGGEVLYSIKTSGQVQSVRVIYSDGNTQDLQPEHPTTDYTDTNTWSGYYYPSSDSMIPLSMPQGTNIDIVKFELVASDGSTIKKSTDLHSDLLTIEGSLAGTVNGQMKAKLSN
ncbi:MULTISPECIES: fibronectin type III domain-containing protein [unclassified Paenibacillus]|uniref:fibronectin type III domain-containing protein n=1 Tax=unclassified Paenibacillus TaxID=185978 RepID=UPI00020D74AE|nr:MULTISPECIES: fibronectin type III domain-containing protein [unclassified Paenibacillus]EGL15055.1 hypothetical protein HMPREF9413_5728 [Paenibacillus sp. HGF7]EPD80473.1 hypothetical protein HMPREF1207_05688 [Paenibacillus sp. HGH0039]